MPKKQHSRRASLLGALVGNAHQSAEGLAAASVASGADPTLLTLLEAAKREGGSKAQAVGEPDPRSA